MSYALSKLRGGEVPEYGEFLEKVFRGTGGAEGKRSKDPAQIEAELLSIVQNDRQKGP